MTDSLLQNPSLYYNECVDPFLPAKRAFFIRAEHYMRYLFAKKFVKRKNLSVIYDIACGDGYGTHILSQVATHVYGFDVSQEFLKVATNTYYAKNITFTHRDFDKDSIVSLSFPKPACIVSFETLEHLENPKKLVQTFYDLLLNNGYLLLSTPNATLEPKKKGKSRNKFHKHIFEREELVRLLKEAGFTVEKAYGQPFTNILLHQRVIRDILNTITERSLFLFRLFSFIGYPNALFDFRSYSIIIVARKK